MNLENLSAFTAKSKKWKPDFYKCQPYVNHTGVVQDLIELLFCE